MNTTNERQAINAKISALLHDLHREEHSYHYDLLSATERQASRNRIDNITTRINQLARSA